jgi:hypothetical protein
MVYFLIGFAGFCLGNYLGRKDGADQARYDCQCTCCGEGCPCLDVDDYDYDDNQEDVIDG